VHLLTDSRGVPLAALISPGQRHESKYVAPLMEQVRLQGPCGRPLRRPRRLAGDKGYSYPGIRQWLRNRDIEAIIPYRSDQLAQGHGQHESFDRVAYRKRNAVERCVGWLKENRRFSTRYEKLAVNFQAMIDLAFIQRYLAVGFSDTA